MARIALKLDVGTLRSTREGMPKLLSMLDAGQARATFLFSLGPDHTGWALRRVFPVPAGFLKQVSRTSVLSNYGLRTLMYGVLLPRADISAARARPECARPAASAASTPGTNVYWQDNVGRRVAAWTRRQMQQAFDRYTQVFGQAQATYGQPAGR